MNISIIFTWISVLLLHASFSHVMAYVGINWGRMASQRMVPSMVVDMLLQNGINEIKVFSTSDNVLEAFVGTGIGVTVSVPNVTLKNLTTPEACKDWLENLVDYVNRGVEIRFVTMGAQPYSRFYFNKTYIEEALPALREMQIALNNTDFRGLVIKATMSHFTDVMNDAIKPSESDFLEEVKDNMIKTCQLLKADDAPVWLDMFPIYNALRLTDDLEFAYFYNNSTAKFMDGDKLYTNIFEVMFDKLVCALEKNGIYGLKIIVGQIGWPTDGKEGGSKKNAQRFHNGLLKYIHSGKGTPRHPGPIDVHIHNIADENRLPIREDAKFVRHWGLYEFDGKPKFNLDLSGQGRNVKLVSATGITHMPKRWCVLKNSSRYDMRKVNKQYEDACKQSDCTSLSPGASCSNLQFPANISYAFNMFFQIKSQKVSEKACNFDGLGIIVPNDPSTGDCIFPVGIIQAEQVAGTKPVISKCDRKCEMSPILLLLWIVFLFI